MDKRRAPGFIRKWAAERLPAADQAQFLEMVETELLALHEGNYSRYRIRPSEFEAWREMW